MARTICLKPCPPDFTLPQLKVPMMGSALKAQGDLSVKGGCDGCELVGNFLLQLSPLVGSLGLPLCLLNCMGALIAFQKATIDALGPPPDPTILIQRLVAVVEKCGCVISMVLPPPVGPICDFLLMVRDIINVFALVINCLTGLITHLASFSLKASLMLTSPDPAIRATGNCLVDQGQGMADLLGKKLGALGALLNVVQPVFDLLASVVPPPFTDTINDFKAGFLVFSGSTGTGTPPGAFLEAIQTFNTIVQTTATIFSGIVSICPS